MSNGIKRTIWLALQIYPISIGGITLGFFSCLIDPWLLLLLVCPLALHFWSGFLYGADRGNSRWTWRSVVLASMALLGALIVFSALYARADRLGGFIWMYGIASLVWTIAAWIVGAMALVDDWM